MNYKNILFYLGFYALLVSILSIINILYSIYFDFNLGINIYLITFVISLIISFVFLFLGYPNYKNISFIEQIIFIFLGFLFIPLLFTIPYYLSIYDISFLNAYFESVSGFTTTGFSIINNVSYYDEPFLLWRSSSQWLGGLFFLASIIGTLGNNQIKIRPIYLVYGGAAGRNFYSNFSYNIIRIILIYLFSTIFIIFLFTLTGIRLLDAFNLSLTTISSGGFISTNYLSDIINDNLQTLILSISLLFPVFNFYLLFNVFTKKFSFNNHQEDIHLALLILILTLFFYFLIIPNESFFEVLLAISSSIATSGISIYSTNFDISLFLILLTIIGGSLISTSSGFKYVRFYILLKISYNEIYRIVKPSNIFNKNLFTNESKIEEVDFKISFLVFILFIISIFILSSILSFDNLNFENSFKLSILTLTNTVNSSLYGMKSINFLDLEIFTKVFLIFFMILGRIEIISLFYIFKKLIFKDY
jgi:trk system potassium uptake protein